MFSSLADDLNKRSETSPVKLDGQPIFEQPNFFILPRLALYDPRVTDADLSVYIVAGLMKGNQDYLEDYLGKVMAYSGYGESKVSTSLGKWQSLGYVNRHRVYSNKPSRLYFDYSLKEDTLIHTQVKRLNRTVDIDGINHKLNIPGGCNMITEYGWVPVPGILYWKDFVSYLFRDTEDLPSVNGRKLTSLTDVQKTVYNVLLDLSFTGKPSIRQERICAKMNNRIKTGTVEVAIAALKACGLLSATRSETFNVNAYELKLRVDRGNEPVDSVDK